MADDIDEFGLIAEYLAPLSEGAPGAFGLTDDAAMLSVAPGMQLAITADAIVAGVHFPVGEPPDLIARRLLRINLSDLAAKGAVPRYYTLSLMLPDATDSAWVAAFAQGLGQDQDRFGITLIGGDTTRTPGPLCLSVTLFGEVSYDAGILRSGARAGDGIYVTGTIGDAALGLIALQGGPSTADPADRDFLIGRFRLPEPRLEVGGGLVEIASAAADISDGLVADLGHICETSQVSAEIGLAEIPLSAAARRAVTDDQPLHTRLLTSGDDYELVFTAPDNAAACLPELAARTGVPLTRIGRIIASAGTAPAVIVRDAQGGMVEVGNGGYRHFRS